MPERSPKPKTAVFVEEQLHRMGWEFRAVPSLPAVEPRWYHDAAPPGEYISAGLLATDPEKALRRAERLLARGRAA